MRSFVAGILVGMLLLAGGVYFYFVSGLAPAAAIDSPMPFEKTLASRSLHAHIAKANLPSPPIPADEPNLLAGAKVYMDQCAGCHGLPGQPAPSISEKMYPDAPLLFKGKGVTDDLPQESYWRVSNGIRLTGMPSFREILTDNQIWQVALLVAHAQDIPASVKKALEPTPPLVLPGSPTSMPVKK